MLHPAVLASTLICLGYLPAPGTCASLAGIALYYALQAYPFVYTAVTAGLVFLGLFSAGKAERVLGKKDAGEIVIDEAAGMLIALAFIPYDIRLVVIGFMTFRIIDIIKPYPVCRLQDVPGSAGIMLDDIAAGVYTNLILQCIRLAG